MHLIEKTFRFHETRLKYLFFRGKQRTPKALIVVFSAFNKEKAMYNYVRSLKQFDVPRLYIKDDFGPAKTGSYYLGEKGKHNVEPAVIELINHTVNKYFSDQCNPKLIFAGSSKGGYAALNFAVEFDNSYAIVGAPQYKLGDHLNEEYFYPMLEDIIGNRNEQTINELNCHIQDKYQNKKADLKQYIYIQYSEIEWSHVFNQNTYEKHIKHLLEDIMTLTDIHLECERVMYEDHSDVYKYYPQYLVRTIERLLKEDANKETM